jgi:hypothetical protein
VRGDEHADGAGIEVADVSQINRERPGQGMEQVVQLLPAGEVPLTLDFTVELWA